MSFEIHMYSAVALATAATVQRAGQHHPLLIFLRQSPNSEHDLARAAGAASAQGWDEVDITRAGTLPADAGEAMEEPVRGAYVRAIEIGEGVLAFPAVVKPAPRKA